MRHLGALLVDDEKKIVQHLKSVIPWEAFGIERVDEAYNGEQALVKVRECKPNLILCDIRMPVMDGFAFLSRLREHDQETEVILLTAYQDFEYARSAIKYRVHDYILKPIDYEDLAKTVDALARAIRGRSDNGLRIGGYAAGAEPSSSNGPGSRSGTLIGDDESGRTLWMATEQLVSGLKRCDREQAVTALEKLAALFSETSAQSPARAQQMAHFSALHLLREMKDIECIDDNEEQAIWARMERGGTVGDMLAVMRDIMEISLAAATNRKSGEKLMLTAKDYIHRHLSHDIGIDELAGRLGISASYFSLLFKQHFGETFVEYVTRQRVEMAKSLLLMTDKSITEIGKTVGYAERRYFTKVFQRYTGDIPSVFREKRSGKV